MTKYTYLKILKILIVIATFLYSSSFGIPETISIQASENKDHMSEIESELSQKKKKINQLGEKEKGILEQFTELEKEVSLKKNLVGQLGVVVQDEYQRKGLGSKLIEKMIGIARSERIQEITLTVSTRNNRALCLYKKYGFKKLRDIKNGDHWRGIKYDCTEMRLSLN